MIHRDFFFILCSPKTISLRIKKEQQVGATTTIIIITIKIITWVWLFRSGFISFILSRLVTSSEYLPLLAGSRSNAVLADRAGEKGRERENKEEEEEGEEDVSATHGCPEPATLANKK